MERLPHGYTNRTRKVAAGVEKTYVGPARHANARRERNCLAALSDRLPVATILQADRTLPSITLSFMPGIHGQDLIAAGHAHQVLRLVGETARVLQGIPPNSISGLSGDGSVVVHGDFGPQNMLFDLDQDRVTGILDWESAHIGAAVEDLAWSEWIVRMHHPEAIDALDALFDGAQQHPPWTVRRDAMLKRVRDLLVYCESANQPSDWQQRLDRTERWAE